MYKKTITCPDFNGVERTETHYFNLTKAEVAEMEMTTSGGYAEMLQNIVDAKDTPALMEQFKKMILKAYGHMKEDGRRFEKSEQISTEFSQTAAYSEIFMELLTNTDAAIEFVTNIMPGDLSEKDVKAAVEKLNPPTEN